MIVLSCIFIVSFFILLLFYLLVFSRFAWRAPSNHRIEESLHQPPVSVIICAKNEAKHLQEFLPAILEQDYPGFEVLVVNDRSTDGSQFWLENFSKQHPRLRVIENSDDSLPGKRNALKKGMEAARHQVILLTDADCKPASAQWILHMMSVLQNEKEIVLGFSPPFPQKGLLQQFIRYENFITALYYFSFSLAKMPYMGVGRNLLYHVPVRTNIGALEHHSGLISGDDDLTVNKIATGRNTTLMIHPKSHVFTVSPGSFRAFLHQKRRHSAAGFHYQPGHQLVLGAWYASQIIFNLSFFTLLFSGFMLLPALLIFLAKNIFQTVIYGKAMRKLNVHNLWIFTPVFDLCLSLFFLTLGGLSLFKPKTWK